MKPSTQRPAPPAASTGGYTPVPAPPATLAAAMPAGVVARLELLQAELGRELARRQQLERSIAHAEAELAAARLELAGTRAGHQQALHQALHDSLTALPNRRLFRARLEQALAGATAGADPALAVMYLDLDGFKPINDRHGHAVGDEVLWVVAARLAHAVRAEDLMSRLGGDEFACIVARPPERSHLDGYASKLLAIIAAPITVAGRCVRVRASIGVAVAPGDGRCANSLLQHADAAMFHAKRQRAGVAFFADCAGDSAPPPATAPGAARGWAAAVRP